MDFERTTQTVFLLVQKWSIEMISITKHMAESLGKMFAELYPRQNCPRHKDTKYLREQIK